MLGHIASSGLVAVKRINPQVLADLTLLQQNAVLRALHNEIAVMQRLNAHPNIARLLYYAQKDDALALVYQLAANGTLYKQLHKEPAEGEPECRLSWQQRLKVLEGVALGLRHMHTCGVFHRDVSAANIGLDAGWGALLLDVGIALMAPLPNGNATNVRSMLGFTAIDRRSGLNALPAAICLSLECAYNCIVINETFEISSAI